MAGDDESARFHFLWQLHPAPALSLTLGVTVANPGCGTMESTASKKLRRAVNTGNGCARWAGDDPCVEPVVVEGDVAEASRSAAASSPGALVAVVLDPTPLHTQCSTKSQSVSVSQAVPLLAHAVRLVQAASTSNAMLTRRRSAPSRIKAPFIF